MFFSIFDNDYFKIVLVLLLGFGFLCLFAYLATLATKFAHKNKFRKMDENDKYSRQAKIYKLIYSKNEMLIEEFKEYFNCDISVLEEDLKEMCDNNVIKMEKDKYSIKR